MGDTQIKKFLSLSKNIQGNSVRVVFQNQIDSNELLDDFIYSYNSNGLSKYDKIISLENTFKITRNEALESTLFHIIIQSYDSIDLTTPTKEYKLEEDIIESIKHKRPFIFIGQIGYLDYLKKLGFETFSQAWDESYNSEKYWIDSVIKVIFILKILQVADINNIYSKINPVLIHNYEKLKEYNDTN